MSTGDRIVIDEIIGMYELLDALEAVIIDLLAYVAALLPSRSLVAP
jgi:hypothetical protein